MKKILLILAIIAVPITVSSGSFDLLGCEQGLYDCPGNFEIICGEPIYGCLHDFGSSNLDCCPNICGNFGNTAISDCY